MKTKRRFKFVGTESDAKGYGFYEVDTNPQSGKVYDEDVIFSEINVLLWATSSAVKNDWEEVFDEDLQQKNILSISGIYGGITFNVSGDFEKCCKVLNFVYQL